MWLFCSDPQRLLDGLSVFRLPGAFLLFQQPSQPGDEPCSQVGRRRASLMVAKPLAEREARPAASMRFEFPVGHFSKDLVLEKGNSQSIG